MKRKTSSIEIQQIKTVRKLEGKAMEKLKGGYDDTGYTYYGRYTDDG
ncbi:MAG: hypothetical protein WBA74_07215 [Cyclobacteriaceae bacterium]